MPRKQLQQPTERGYVRPITVLASVPGLSRDELTRWNQACFIESKFVTIGGAPMYIYPEAEIPKIRRMVELVRKGYAPRTAYGIASGKYEKPVQTSQVREAADISHQNDMRKDFEALKRTFDEFAAKYKLA